MNHDDVKTLDDAKQYLLERKSVSREVLHMLSKQLSARAELFGFAREHGITITEP